MGIPTFHADPKYLSGPDAIPDHAGPVAANAVAARAYDRFCWLWIESPPTVNGVRASAPEPFARLAPALPGNTSLLS